MGPLPKPARAEAIRETAATQRDAEMQSSMPRAGSEVGWDGKPEDLLLYGSEREWEGLCELAVFGKEQVASTCAKDASHLLGCGSCGGALLGEDLDLWDTAFAHDVSHLSLNQGTD